MEKIYLASGNVEKVKEAQLILGVPIEIADIELEEVQSMNLEIVARKKVEEAFRIVGKPVIVDDVGFYIEAWNGFPGPLVKHLFATMGNKGFLKIMENETNRKVAVKSMIGFHDGTTVRTFLGEFEGTISTEELGDDGWGFDPIVIPNGETLTLAQLGREHKNHNSHRALSLNKLKEFLDSVDI